MKKSCKNCYLGPNKCLGVFFPEWKTCCSQWGLKLNRNEIKIGDVYLTKNGKKAIVIAIYDSVFVCTIEGKPIEVIDRNHKTENPEWTPCMTEPDWNWSDYDFRVKKS